MRNVFAVRYELQFLNTAINTVLQRVSYGKLSLLNYMTCIHGAGIVLPKRYLIIFICVALLLKYHSHEEFTVLIQTIFLSHPVSDVSHKQIGFDIT
jgi:hypothetical protein